MDDINIFKSTWVFKIKCFPTGLIKKLKARLCARGDLQQQGINVSVTFEPVVSWSTVHILLILSVLLDFHTTQVDYTAVFVQAPFDTDVYIDLPQGWRQLNKMGLIEPFKEGHVLKLKNAFMDLVKHLIISFYI